MNPADTVVANQHVMELWLTALLLGASTYFLARWRRWLGVIPLVLAAFVSVVMWLELSDATMAGGIEIAFGSGYLLHSRVAGWASLCLAALAYSIAARSKRRAV
jgi:ABC-type Fe3+ transport system permease subunit